jgi:tetratricopeptide (TPR) repeat protein
MTAMKCRGLRSAAVCLMAASFSGGALPAFAHGDLQEQIVRVTAQIQAKPDNAELYLKRADLHFHKEDRRAAEADYNRAEKLNPSLDAVHLGRGRLFLAAQRFDEAKAEIEKFLTLHPAHVEALVTRARIEAARGRWLPAAADFAKAIEHSPHPEPDYCIEQARALVSAGEARLDEAIGVLDKGSVASGSLPALEMYALDLEVRAKRFEAALARIARLSAKSARQETWLERSGDIHLLAGHRDDAAQCFQRAREAIAKLPGNVRETKAVRERDAGLVQKLKLLETPISSRRAR